MMQEKTLKRSIILFLVCLVAGGFQGMISQAETAPQPVVTEVEVVGKVTYIGPAAPKEVQAARYTDTSVSVSWERKSGVDGYVIYKYDAVKKKYKKYKVIANIKKHRKSNDKCRLLFVDEIGHGKSAKYKVSAYKNIDGKKRVGDPSYEVSAKAYKQGDKKVNAGKIVTRIPGEDYPPGELGYFATLQLSSKVSPGSYSKAKRKKLLRDTVRWYSSNPAIATVDKNGLVRTKAKAGKCFIYARAHDGRKSNKIQITVKNYAKPGKDNLSLWAARENFKLYGAAYEMFTNYYKTTTDIAEYFYLHRPKGNERFFCWMENGEVKMEPENYVTGEIKQKIYNFVKDFPYDIQIFANGTRVDFDEVYGTRGVNREVAMNVTFMYDKKYIDPQPYTEKYEPAPNWHYGYFAEKSTDDYDDYPVIEY